MNTPYLSVFSLNAGKYGPEKTPCLDIFTQWSFLLPPRTKVPDWTYIRRWEDLQGIFWTFFVHSIYALYPGSIMQCPCHSSIPHDNAEKMKFSTNDFLSKYDQKLRVWSHLLKRFLVGNVICCKGWLLMICVKLSECLLYGADYLNLRTISISFSIKFKSLNNSWKHFSEKRKKSL